MWGNITVTKVNIVQQFFPIKNNVLKERDIAIGLFFSGKQKNLTQTTKQSVMQWINKVF